jgi:hypothetical protein
MPRPSTGDWGARLFPTVLEGSIREEELTDERSGSPLMKWMNVMEGVEVEQFV